MFKYWFFQKWFVFLYSLSLFAIFIFFFNQEKRFEKVRQRTVALSNQLDSASLAFAINRPTPSLPVQGFQSSQKPMQTEQGERIDIKDIQEKEVPIVISQSFNNLLELNLRVEPINDSLELQMGSIINKYPISFFSPDSLSYVYIPWRGKTVAMPLPFSILGNRIMVNFELSQSASQKALSILNNKVFRYKRPGSLNTYFPFSLVALKDRLEIRDAGNFIGYSILIPKPNRIVFQGTHFVEEYNLIILIGLNGIELVSRELAQPALIGKLADSLGIKPIYDFMAKKPINDIYSF